MQLLLARFMPMPSDLAGPLERIDTAAGALAIVAGVEMLLRWRLDGRALAWWAGLAFIILGVPGVVGLTSENAPLWLGGSAIAALLLVAARRAPDVDANLSLGTSVDHTARRNCPHIRARRRAYGAARSVLAHARCIEHCVLRPGRRVRTIGAGRTVAGARDSRLRVGIGAPRSRAGRIAAASLMQRSCTWSRARSQSSARRSVCR